MIIYRYIFSDILKATLAVTFVLLAIVTSGRLAKYLSKASTGDLAPELVLTIILYRIPDFLPLILPLGLFIGTLMVFGRMYIESEMTALNAAGVSKLQMLILTLTTALIVSVVVAALTLWLAPASLAKVESTLNTAKNSDSLMYFREGSFQASNNGRAVAYMGNIEPGNQFGDIFVIEQLENQRTVLMVAQQGRLSTGDSDNTKILSLENGRIYEGQIGKNDYQLSRFSGYTQNLYMEPEEEALDLEIDALPTLEIWQQRTPETQAALQWRFSLPASVLVVGVLALALSRTDKRQGRYTKMLPAIGIYLIYIILLSGVRSAIESQSVVVSSLWFVHLAFFVLALLLLFYQEIALYWREGQSRP